MRLSTAPQAARIITNTLASRGLDIPPVTALIKHDLRLGLVLL